MTQAQAALEWLVALVTTHAAAAPRTVQAAVAVLAGLVAAIVLGKVALRVLQFALVAAGVLVAWRILGA